MIKAMQGKSNPASLHLMNLEGCKTDDIVESPKTAFSVIPVKTGIQEFQEALDSRSPPSRGQASRE